MVLDLCFLYSLWCHCSASWNIFFLHFPNVAKSLLSVFFPLCLVLSDSYYWEWHWNVVLFPLSLLNFQPVLSVPHLIFNSLPSSAASAPHHSALGSCVLHFILCIYLKMKTVLDLPAPVVVRKYEADSLDCASSKPGEPVLYGVVSDDAQRCGNRKSRLLG